MTTDVVESTKEAVHDLERAPPGRRFQSIYEKRQKSRHGGLKNGAFIAGGLVVVGVGIATYPIPVIPSEVVILVGLATLAQGSRLGARWFDAVEVRFRRRFGWLIERWKALPRAGKIAAGTAWSVLLSGISYGIYRALQ